MFPDTLYGSPVVLDYGPRSLGDLTEYERVQTEAALPLVFSSGGPVDGRRGLQEFLDAIS